jgi:hypothetical protein
MLRSLIALSVLACAGAEARAEAVTSVRLVLPPQPDAVVANIARIFARQVESRCDARVTTRQGAPLTVKLTIEPGVGAEGFRIADGAKGTIRVVGNDTRGLLYGVGKLLHTSSYSDRGFTPGTWRGVSVPSMPVRGMYLATHFHNYYQVAPIEEVQRYIEDLSLWGVNSFLVWFGMEEFSGIGDPKAQAMIERLRALLRIVRGLGLNVCLGSICNDGYANSPVELRADDSTVDHKGYHTRMGNRIYNLGNELCPSKPGVLEMELQYCREKYDAFKDIGIDYWFFTPYDNGGCTCPQCAPWGANGYLRMAEQLVRGYRSAFPGGKVVLGTWYFDRWAEGEWDGMAAQFGAAKPDWIDYVMADNFEEYPRYPLEHGVPGGFPLLNFPEISMWGQEPWGGYGANPQPGRLQARWDEIGSRLSGGFPYSEGIYEDINKVICAQLYWEPDRPAPATVRDYIAFEFSREAVDDVTAAVRILEANHLRDRISESAVTAARLLARADRRLTPQARGSWRWRLLRIRAAIDQELYRNARGQGRSDVLQRAYEELVTISHAQDAWSMLRPVPIPAVDTDGPRLAAGYAEAVAASDPLAWWRMDRVRDREVEDVTGNGNAATREDGATVIASGIAGGSRAACLGGGRLRATIRELPDAYSVEFWFLNTVPSTARPVTAYLLSRGPDGPEGTPGESLGISGTSAVDTVPPGRLFFYGGDADRQIVGRTELSPDTWYHVVLVRDGMRVAVYLDGSAAPELSGVMAHGYADGLVPILVGGRNDGFANLQGKMAEVAVYGRALTSEEVGRHHRAARPRG